MDIISEGAVTRHEYVACLDDLVGIILDRLGDSLAVSGNDRLESLVRAQAAGCLAVAWHEPLSRFHGHDDLLEKAGKFADASITWHEHMEFATVQSELDFVSLALCRYLAHAGDEVPGPLRERIVCTVRVCADLAAYTGSYINHNLNTALVAEHVYHLTGDERYHHLCKVRTRTSLHYFDGNDGRNPEIAQTYGIYGLSLLAEIAASAQHDQDFAREILPYVQRSAETYPTYYLYEDTGDFMAINSRETVKMLSFAAVTMSLDGFEIVAACLSDGRYRSVARRVYDYWLSNVYDGGKFVALPRWQQNDTFAPFHLVTNVRLSSREGLCLIASAYAIARLLDYQKEIEPREFQIHERVVGKQSFFRRRTGTSLAVISNILYSPVAYMTREGTCLVGEELQGGIYRPEEGFDDVKTGDGYVMVYMRNGLDYKTSKGDYTEEGTFASASVYSHLLDVYSSALVDNGSMIWVMTLNRAVRNLRYDLYLYWRSAKMVMSQDGEIVEGRTGQRHEGLRWVLINNGDSPGRFFALALLTATAHLNICAGGGSITYASEESTAPPRSILLVREWQGEPAEFDAWLRRWRVLPDEGACQINSPDHTTYLVEHRCQAARCMRVVGRDGVGRG